MADKTVTVRDGGDYTSLNAALAGESANLVTNTCILTIDCGNISDTTAANTGTGYTTSASYYINIVASDNHNGLYGTSSYRISRSGYGGTIVISEAYTRVTGLLVTSSSTTDSNHHGIVLSGSGATGCLINRCIVKSGGVSIGSVGISTADGENNTIQNTIVYDFISATNCGIYTYGAHTYIYNCTIQNCLLGISNHASASTSTIKNVLFSGNTSDCTGSAHAGTDYNATNNASIGYTVDGGGNTHDRLSQVFTFINASGDNFHLESTDAGAKDYGDSTGMPFSDDIDGVTRTGVWDIGADEYVAAGGTNYTRVINESVGLLDSSFRVVGCGRSVADASSVSDSVLRTVARFRSAVEAAGVSDSSLRSLGMFRRAADPAGAVDFVSRSSGAWRGASDAVGVADAVAYALMQLISRVVSDAVGVSDLAPRTMAVLRAVVDDAGAADAVVRAAASVRSVSDAVGAADSASRAVAFARVLADAIALADPVEEAEGFARAISDALGLSDEVAYQITAAVAHVRAIADAVGVTDSLASSAFAAFSIVIALSMPDSFFASVSARAPDEVLDVGVAAPTIILGVIR